MRKNIPLKRDPRVMGHAVLELFENTEDAEMSDKDLTDNFIVRWYEVINPYVKYKDRFIMKNGWATDSSVIDIKHVRSFYKKFVLEEEWPEQKYVYCLDSILSTVNTLSTEALLEASKVYDRGELPLQLADKNAVKRRKRI